MKICAIHVTLYSPDIYNEYRRYAELLQSTTQSFVPVILMLGAASLCSSWFRVTIISYFITIYLNFTMCSVKEPVTQSKITA